MTEQGLFGEKSCIQAIGMLLIDFTSRAPTAILSNHFARGAPFQRGPRSSNSRQTDVGFRIHMRVGRIDQNSATPIDTFQRFTHVHPMDSENNDVALGRLLPGPRDGAWTKISDKTSQCRRTAGIGYNYGVTSIYQVTAERAVTVPAPINPTFIINLQSLSGF